MNVRVRFAPSPTGGLHLGGIRTVLFNYLFAKKHNGKFIVRIEDTDQKRFVQGAEAYIMDCLDWCGLVPDESVVHGGEYGPYRQSERKDLYQQYAKQLIDAGQAYYGFDTPEEIEAMRERLKAAGKDSLQYDSSSRMQMKNSLALSPEETSTLLQNGTPYVIRIKVNPGEEVVINDLIRGEIKIATDAVDDKVLMKADGMPTYHLAVVVDDFLMKISHAFRGEEWLPSAPVHVLVWKYLFGLENMPLWAHLPLILKPDGNGKLSKRDADRLGFPVYALNWTDAEGVVTKGFKEEGFLPQAFNNLLAVLGWNDGTEQEVYTLEEMIAAFSIDHIHKGGAKFDYEKAKWYNQEWIKKLSATELLPAGLEVMEQHGVAIDDKEKFAELLELVKERCVLLGDIFTQTSYFYSAPEQIDVASLQPKWTGEKSIFFTEYMSKFDALTWNAASLEETFKLLATDKNIKPGDLQLPFRIMLVGQKFGPGVFEIAARLSKEEVKTRIQKTLSLLNN